MPSTYTTRNRLEKQAAGENSNTWGTRVNDYLTTPLDAALDGITSFTLSTTKTLTENDGTADESRSRQLWITGGTGGAVTIPAVEKVYIVKNDASGAVTFDCGGDSASVPAGKIDWVLCDGTDCYSALASIGLTGTLGSAAFLAETTAAQFRANTADKVLSTDQVWSAADYVALSDAATVALDLSTGINFSLTIGGNRTLGAPTNTKNGQSGAIVITQDATGSRTLAYHANWKFAGGSDPVLSTAAGAVDVLFYQVVNSTTILGTLVKGFA